jgi:tetratricopeptide (TPR) repeat protein
MATRKSTSGQGAQQAHSYVQMAVTLARQNRFAEAVQAFRQASRMDPRNVQVQYGLGNCYAAIGDIDNAIIAFRQTVELNPEFADAHFRLGSMLSETGQVAEGFRHYMQRARLVHGGQKTKLAPVPEPLHKIKHDREQQDYLKARLGHRSAFHLEEGERIAGPAVNPANTLQAVMQEWRTRAPQFVVLDNFLMPEALNKLRLYCAGSTVWRRIYDAGYIGATPEDGFAFPLMAQIVEEIRVMFSEILAPHPFRYMGAFKYDSELSTGTNIHADNSAVNFNLYVAPDAANLDPESGGMDIWDVPAPEGEDMRIYNGDETKARKFLADSKARVTSIPHKANRAILFKSDMFHKTADCKFREGYLNKRINISMLFGYRGAPTR